MAGHIIKVELSIPLFIVLSLFLLFPPGASSVDSIVNNLIIYYPFEYGVLPKNEANVVKGTESAVVDFKLMQWDGIKWAAPMTHTMITNSDAIVGTGSLELSDAIINIDNSAINIDSAISQANGLTIASWYKFSRIKEPVNDPLDDQYFQSLFQLGNGVNGEGICYTPGVRALAWLSSEARSSNNICAEQKFLSHPVGGHIGVDGKWHHFAWTLSYSQYKQQSTWTFYIDGVIVAINNSGCYPSSSNSLHLNSGVHRSRSATLGRLGANNYPLENKNRKVSSYYKRFVDDFRVYARILNQNEVLMLVNSINVTNPTAIPIFMQTITPNPQMAHNTIPDFPTTHIRRRLAIPTYEPTSTPTKKDKYEKKIPEYVGWIYICASFLVIIIILGAFRLYSLRVNKQAKVEDYVRSTFGSEYELVQS